MQSKFSTTQVDSTKELPLMEEFYTIQGEGYHQGKAAYFIRLAGCDVGCTWCDVKESWDANQHPIVSLLEIENKIKAIPAEIVVVTGGEPLMYNLQALTDIIHKHNKQAHIETSGAYPLSGNWDWICLSPKRFKKALPECLAAAHELKTIVVHPNDLRFAEKFVSQVSSECKLYLQPEWSVKDEIIPHIVTFVMQNPQYIISLQTHKYIDVP